MKVVKTINVLNVKEEIIKSYIQSIHLFNSLNVNNQINYIVMINGYIIEESPYYSNKSISEIEIQTLDAVKVIILQVINQLNILHKLGYIHKRIKPNNILITDSSEYILSDCCDNIFNGIESNNISGYFYQSPESLKGKIITKKSDIYSIGCILYYLITGEHPIHPLKKNIELEKEIISMLNEDERKRPTCEVIMNILFNNNKNMKYSNVLYRVSLMNECDIKDEELEDIIGNDINKFNSLIRDSDKNDNYIMYYLPHLIRLCWKNPNIIDYIHEAKNYEDYGVLDSIKKPYILNIKGISQIMMEKCKDRLKEIKVLNFGLCKYESLNNFVSAFRNLERLNASNSRNEFDEKIMKIVKYLPNLTSFKYSFNGVYDKDFYVLCYDLPIMNKLEEIVMSNNYLTTKSVKILNHYLYKFPNLKYIDLHGNKIKSKGVKILLYLYKRNPSFDFTVTILNSKVFDLLLDNEYVFKKKGMIHHWNNICDYALKLLRHKNKKIFSLVYSFYCLSDECCDKVCDCLDDTEKSLFNEVDEEDSYYLRMYYLKIMRIKSIYLNQKQKEYMLYAFEHCPSIKCVVLERNELDDDFYIEMLNNITHLRNLEVLVMKSDDISNKTGFQLIEVLPSFPSLKVLDISDTFISELCLSKLITLLPKMKELECIKIGGTPLSDSFIESFIETIKKARILSDIYIDNCSLNEKANNVLLKGLCKEIIRSLSISYNNFTDANCIMLSDLLNSSKYLTYLNLEGNKITEVGCSILFENVKNNIPLEVINLKNNQINETGVSMMFKLARRNLHEEKNMYFSGNPFIISRDVLRDQLGADDPDLVLLDIGDLHDFIQDVNNMSDRQMNVIAKSFYFLNKLLGMFKNNEDDLNYLSFIHMLICKGKRNLTKQYILENIKSMKSEYKMIQGFRRFNCLEYDNLLSGDIDYLINNLHFMENTKRLILRNNNVNDINKYKDLIKSISSFTNLEVLEITRSNVNDEIMDCISNEFSNFTNSLKSLNLSDNLITEQSTTELRDSIHLLPLLEELNLNNNNLNSKGINNVLNGLYAMQNLKALTLQNTGLVDQNCRLLFQIVNHLSNLKSLDISYNCITYKGVGYMENVIQVNYSLTSFDIRNNLLDSDSILLVKDICSQYFTLLGECFIVNDISEDDIIVYENEKKVFNQKQIYTIIKDKNLIHFIIEKCRDNKENNYYLQLLIDIISSKHCNGELKDEMADNFDENDKTYKLLYGIYSQCSYKYNNCLEDITDSDLIFILNKLKMAKRIDHLSMNNFCITQDILKLIGEVFDYHGELLSVDISNNKMGNKMMWSFIELLRSLPRLESLNISNNPITQEFFSITKNDFKDLRYLISLKINNVELNEKGNNDLICLIKEMKDLKEIDLHDTGFNDSNCLRLSEISDNLLLIEIINLKNNKITIEGYYYLFNKFRSSKCEIYLSGNTVNRVNEELYNMIIEYDKNYVDLQTIIELSNDIDKLRREMVRVIEESESLFSGMMILYKDGELIKKDNLFAVVLRILLSSSKFYFLKENILSYFKEDEKEYKMIKGVVDKSSFSYDDESGLNEEDILFFIHYIPYIVEIKSIQIVNCNISDSFFVSLLHNLKNHSELEILIMNNNSIGNKGMNELICNFRYLKNLKKLYIGENQFTYDGIKKFKDNTIFLKNLEELVLYNNNIGMKGVNEIINSLHFNEKMKLLSISGCGIELSNKKIQSKLLKLNYEVISF